jgi:hypothetical protein
MGMVPVLSFVACCNNGRRGMGAVAIAPAPSVLRCNKLAISRRLARCSFRFSVTAVAPLLAQMSMHLPVLLLSALLIPLLLLPPPPLLPPLLVMLVVLLVLVVVMVAVVAVVVVVVVDASIVAASSICSLTAHS